MESQLNFNLRNGPGLRGVEVCDVELIEQGARDNAGEAILG